MIGTERQPKIYFDGKRRDIKELEDLLYHHYDDCNDDHIPIIQEIQRCIGSLLCEYDYEPNGFTWNGDDEYRKSYKRVLKKKEFKE